MTRKQLAYYGPRCIRIERAGLSLVPERLDFVPVESMTTRESSCPLTIDLH